MKTKHLIFAVIAIMLLTLLGTTVVKAQNGPSDSYAFICLENMEEYHEIYSADGGDYDLIEGVTYDKASNTLTLNNVNRPTLSIDANKMGDDFKIKLIGENNFAMICAWGDEYGGSVTITGDGTLNLDTTGLGIKVVGPDEQVNAISLYAEHDNAKLIVENTATVNIKAQSNVIAVIDTPSTNGNSSIILKNGQYIADKIIKEEYSYQRPASVRAIKYGDLGTEEHYTIYEKNGKKYGRPDYGDTSVYITSLEIIYDEHTGKYFFDPTTDEYLQNIAYATEEKLAADGYTTTNQQVTVDTWASSMGDYGYGLSEDPNGKQYVRWIFYSDGVETYEVYDISDYELTLPDGKTYKVLTMNTTVDPTTLEEKYEIIKDGNYNYTVNLKELNILPGDQSPEEVIAKEESIALEVPVEAAEQNPEDVAASGEVGKIVNEVLAKESGTVEGIDEELAEKIREKAEAGETILVAVVTEEVKAEDVKEDAEKAEEKVSGTNKKIVAFYDIDVLVKTATEELGNVTKLGDKITLAVPVPTGLPAVPAGYTRTFKIIRVHNGVAEEIEATVDGDKLVFLSDVFSTYAVAYEDTKTTSNPSTGDNIVLFIALFSVAVIGLVSVKKYLK